MKWEYFKLNPAPGNFVLATILILFAVSCGKKASQQIHGEKGSLASQSKIFLVAKTRLKNLGYAVDSMDVIMHPNILTAESLFMHQFQYSQFDSAEQRELEKHLNRKKFFEVFFRPKSSEPSTGGGFNVFIDAAADTVIYVDGIG